MPIINRIFYRAPLGVASFAMALGVGWPRESAAANCPYHGDYIECLTAGETVDFCKRHVLNCQNDDPMEPESASCGWLVDEVIDDECPLGDGFVHVGIPIDVTVGSITCPYDSYVECLQSEEHYQDVTWCKRHQLTCVPQSNVATVVVPLEAECGPLGLDGTILFEGNAEIIGGNYCLHVTSYDYTGPFNSIVNDEIDAVLAKPNPDCGGDTYCICSPASCL